MANITPTHLTDGNGGVSGTSYTTASITPAAGSLVLIVVLGSSGTAGAFTAASGCGITWSKLFDQQGSAGDTPRWLTVFVGQAIAPTSGAITLTSSTTQGDAFWTVEEFANADVSGAGAIVQHGVHDTTGTHAGETVTLSAVANANNLIYGAVFNGQGSTITQGAAFTQLFQSQHSIELQSQYAFNQTSVPWTWTSVNNWSYAVALEISIPRGGFLRFM